MTTARRSAMLLAAASALLVSLVAFVPMAVSGHITRDSGVFLYTGMVVTRGGMPYVDSWDHKGPLLAVLEATAWQLGGGIIGAPVLEAVALFFGLAIAGLIWARRIGNWAAVAVLVAGVTYLAVFEGGNFTETWLFPFQLVACSLAAHVALAHGREASVRMTGGLGLVVGLALSVGLFTRMNNVVGLLLLVIVGAVLLRHRIVFVGAVALIVATVAASLGLWLWTGNALRAAVDQYVGYNLFYSGGTGAGDRLGAFVTLSQLLFSGAVVAVTLVLLGAMLVSARREGSDGTRTRIVVVLFLAVGLLDALSQMVSGRPYPHYLVVAIAGFTVVVVSASASLLPSVSAAWSNRRTAARPLIPGIAVLVTVAIVMSSSTTASLQALRTVAGAGVYLPDTYQAQLVDRVRLETSPDDRVLVHGAETWILASAQRLSPTSITYSLPVEQGYGGLPAQYLADIESVPPALIVESPVSCGISIECPPELAHFDGLAPWVASNYELEGDIVGFRFWKRVAS
jgi:hypothetical protein